jgi:release factor glutamine methyltransferase
MLTILEAIRRSTEYLAKKGIEDARLNAELLLCSILKCKKLNLYLNYDRPLADEEVSVYREYLKRRSEREPLQYIVGEVEFYGLVFKVDKSVLIPRPETEILVEKIIEENKDRQVSILDIGTGSGNIAVALKYHLPSAEVTAVDKSEDALKTASHNAEMNSCKVDFIRADIMTDDINILNTFDIIVSNPPYVAENEFAGLAPELRVFEPKMALSDMSDGYAFYRRILSLTDTLLEKEGKIYFEMGAGQSSAIKQLMLNNNFENIKVVKDYQQIDRVISGEKK